MILPTPADAINAVLATPTRAGRIERVEAAGVPVGPVHSIGEALTHEQARERGMVIEVEHPQAGRTHALGCPLHFSATPTVRPQAAPQLGQHTRGLLREYGYGDREIDELYGEAAVA